MNGTNDAVETIEALRQRMHRLRVQNAVFRIAARHHNLLQRHVFEELSDVVAKFTAVRAMGLIVRDGQTHVRVYALSKERPDFAVMGARIPITPHIIQQVHVEGRTLVCDDTRTGAGADLLLAKAGFLSYVEIPVRASGEEEVLAGLMFGFREKEGARAAPMQILQDVTEVVGANMQRATEAARERRLAMILATSGDAMISWDKDFRITDANPAAEVLAGRSREHLLGTSIRAVLSHVPAVTEDVPPGPNGARLQLLTPAGPRPVAATITNVPDDPIVAAHALLRDQSEVVKAEQEAARYLAQIRRLEELHRNVLDNAPLILFRLSLATLELEYLNQHAERLLGVPTREALQTPGFLVSVHADEDSRRDFERAVGEARSGRTATYEAHLRRRVGEDIAVQGNVYPFTDATGAVTGIEGVLWDVTSEQAARSRLVQADRLSTIGTLAAGVAHEINNPAAFVLLGIDMLDRLLQTAGADLAEGPRSQAAGLVRDLRDAVRRIVDIARDLRLFASAPGDSGRRTLVDVNRAVESALTLTRGHIIERAQVQRDLADVPPVLMEENRLGQVLVNLLVNAAQAIPKPGALGAPRPSPSSLAPGDSSGPHTITVTTRVHDDDVLIEISDTGVGIAPEHLNRIFAPFFTTKTPDLGTGLGLSISKDIIARAGGSITAVSPVPGKTRGTRFTVALPIPREPDSAPDPRAPSSRPVPRVARARVLLVEDEPALANALADALRPHHDVDVARNGREALDLLLPVSTHDEDDDVYTTSAAPQAPTTLPSPSGDAYTSDAAPPERTTLVSGKPTPKLAPRYDAVLCDLRMPEMSGEALYREVRAYDTAQAQAFIFMTGVGFGADVERFLRDASRPVLEKPFPPEKALDLIAKLVAKRPP